LSARAIELNGANTLKKCQVNTAIKAYKLPVLAIWLAVCKEQRNTAVHIQESKCPKLAVLYNPISKEIHKMCLMALLLMGHNICLLNRFWQDNEMFKMTLSPEHTIYFNIYLVISWMPNSENHTFFAT
jgi:hypothetical protein